MIPLDEPNDTLRGRDSIPLDKLRAVQRIVTHEDCADGIASAMILTNALPDATIMFLHYGSPEHQTLKAEPGMLFCDFTPPRERVQEFVDAGAIVLDHHQYAKDIVERFGELGVYTDKPGQSGAWLAYIRVWYALDVEGVGERPWQDIRNLAALAGIRDTWQRDRFEWHRACEQAEALTFWPRGQLLLMAREYPRRTWVDVVRQVGPVLYAKRLDEALKLAEKLVLRTSDAGTTYGITPTLKISDVAEAAGAALGFIVGFGFEPAPGGFNLVFSMRSRGAFDVGAFAKWCGGGGHAKAAGFTVQWNPTTSTLNPMYELNKRLWRFEWGHASSK